MTQNEKIELLKDTIQQLYSKEGRSKNYIATLLKLDRKKLTEKIKEWDFQPSHIAKLSHSGQVYANKNKNIIINYFSQGLTLKKMAEKLNVSVDFLNNIIEKTPELKELKDKYIATIGQKKREKQARYDFRPLSNEEWKPVLGYENYFVSNQGRVKSYKKRYDCYQLLIPTPNARNGRLYVKFPDNNIQLARLVGLAFVEGHSEKNNTIDHINGDINDNRAENLQWVSQKNNNQLAYNRGRQPAKAYNRNGKFKEIIIDDTYHFKTIISAAKFLGVSNTQFNRYVSGECKTDRKINFIY